MILWKGKACANDLFSPKHHPRTPRKSGAPSRMPECLPSLVSMGRDAPRWDKLPGGQCLSLAGSGLQIMFEAAPNPTTRLCMRSSLTMASGLPKR
jgi:hypothetical protein